ncbi:MAG: rhomboid family intramembrane serine protease [Proteobacteria bacterium]|uniref:rhomboid family intramembrane serine protease n=1 Tax=Rudaea sp. TaxID=2136325 RepID=UPI00322012F7|nr:rhomboid family intramembrane serine protease [Pseudomonadota bacterium]
MLTTISIIAVTCIVSFLGFSNAQLIDKLIFWPPAVKRGQYYRFLSHALIHADGTHLLFNMITLYFFGRALEGFYEHVLGSFGFALFYAGAVVVAMLPSYFANRDNPAYRSLGASGGVSAVLFAFILLSPWSRIYVWFLPMPAILYAVAYVAYSIYMERHGRDNVNHSAHLWGGAYGVVFTLLAEPRVLPAFLQQLASPRF